ncbi:MAG: hypothetical protein CL569_09305 [Alphaproteobacteria bacterium]|nr:hypothetical protein [Alphaproteobacteria bacterium]
MSTVKPRQALHWGNPPNGTYNAPIHLGLQRDAFGSPDLLIDTRDNRNGAEYTQALLAGEFDMGHIGTPPLFAALAETDAYVIVGQGVVRHPCFWVVALCLLVHSHRRHPPVAGLHLLDARRRG